MLKIIKKLVKGYSDYRKKYVLIYRESIYGNYYFMYCDEIELRQALEQIKMFDFHIFLTKDELKFETNIDLEEVE